MDCYDQEDKQQTVDSLNIDMIVSGLFIVSIIIAIYITNKRKVAIINNMLTKSVINEINKLSEISLMIIIIAALYFSYRTFKTYQGDPKNINLSYFLASFLVLIAAIIRLISLMKSQTSVEGPEDIFG